MNKNESTMKEDMNMIFGKEWKWFLSLAPMMKLRVAWFVVSFCLMLLFVENCGVVGLTAIGLNFCASAIALKDVDGYGLDE